jgi:hypothetical protein
MAQKFADIQAALDTLTLTVPGITSANLITENVGSNFAMRPDITSLLAVRTTLVPGVTTNETLGAGGNIKLNGLYIIDILTAQNVGYGPARVLGDAILAKFYRGWSTLLTDGRLMIESSYPSVNLMMGGKIVNKIYLTQIMVRWWLYTTP